MTTFELRPNYGTSSVSMMDSIEIPIETYNMVMVTKKFPFTDSLSDDDMEESAYIARKCEESTNHFKKLKAGTVRIDETAYYGESDSEMSAGISDDEEYFHGKYESDCYESESEFDESDGEPTYQPMYDSDGNEIWYDENEDELLRSANGHEDGIPMKPSRQFAYM